MSIETAKERELLDAAAQGSQLAYRELIHLHQSAVYRFAWAMLGEEDAQRVTENTFLTAWRQLDYLKQLNLTFRARLFQLVCIDCAAAAKRQRRHRVNLPASQGDDALNFPFAPRRYDPRTNMEHLALQADIEDALRALPLSMRQALLLHKMGGFADTQIADIISGEAQKIHEELIRSRALLRRQILLSGGFFPLSQEEGVGPSAPPLRACEQYRSTLDAAADNLCTPEEKQSLSAHMAGCPGCQGYYDALCAINHGISVMKQEVPGDMAQYILQRIREDAGQDAPSAGEHRVRRPRFAFGRFTIIGLCIALILLAYSGGILNRGGGDDTPDAPGQGQSQQPPKAPDRGTDSVSAPPGTNDAPDDTNAPENGPGGSETIQPGDETDSHPDPEAPQNLVPAGETYAAVYIAEPGAEDLLRQACTLSFPASLAGGAAATYYIVPVEAQEALSADLDAAAAGCAPYTAEPDAVDSAAGTLLYIVYQ